MKPKKKKKKKTTHGNICVVQLVLRSARSPRSSAPWERQMFTVAPGHKRSIGPAIWR